MYDVDVGFEGFELHGRVRMMKHVFKVSTIIWTGKLVQGKLGLCVM